MDRTQRILSDNIRRRREAAYPNRNRFAKAVGMEWEDIRDIEEGRQMPQIPTLVRLAAALKCAPSKLLKGI